MVRNCLWLTLSILLILVSLPFLAASFLIATLGTAAVAAFPRLHRQRQTGAVALNRLQPVEQFGFEGALAAYEQLIGAHAGRTR